MKASINLGEVDDKNFENVLSNMPKSHISWYI